MCSKGILIDSRGRCNPNNKCRTENCRYCELADDNEKYCVFCEPSYFLTPPYGSCKKEKNTEKQKNCHLLFIDGTCRFCDLGYYVT